MVTAMHNVGPVLFWLIGAMIAVVCALLYVCVILKLHEWGIYPLRIITRTVHRPLFELLLIVVMVGGVVQYGATKGTNGNDRASQPSRAPISDSGSLRRDGGAELTRHSGEITNLCFTCISVFSNMATLAMAWPTNLFTEGTILDYFAKPYSFNQVWQWIGCRDVLPGMTNLSVEVDTTDIQGVTNQPSAMFFKVQDRWSCATTMADSDADGLPDVYELHNGTNPYVPDYDRAPKLTVGSSGAYATFEAAICNSSPYSILSLTVEDFVLKQPLQMPDHPVMLTGPHNRYATLHSASTIAAVILDRGQDSRTLFRNLNLVLEAQSSFQAAFWIGGNLPWSGIGASPTFENIRVRAMYPNCLYYGWHYYRDNGDASSLSNCVMNAAGATAAVGVYAYDGPRIDMSGCTFVNIPTNAISYESWIKSGTNVTARVASASAGYSWAGCPLDAFYGSNVDSDGDGISDYDEVFEYDTDPYLLDSDGDGESDFEEICNGTDPRDVYSHFHKIIIATSADDSLLDVTNYIAWGVSSSRWETNDLYQSGVQLATNTFSICSFGSVYVKAFRDFNRNGMFDEGCDMLLIKEIPGDDVITTLALTFGDVDCDGVLDWEEMQDGTNPLDSGNYGFVLSLVEQGIFTTSNSLCAKVCLGSHTVLGPVYMTNKTWQADLGYLEATSNETVTAYFWDDVNSNMVYDLDECCVAQNLPIRAHHVSITNTLGLGAFDGDGDGMLDWWEIRNSQAQLSPTNSADAFCDPDADGLINLHEYWANCDPLVPDGSNTVLSALSRSIDRRLPKSNRPCLYLNYSFTGVTNGLVVNTNSWAHDIDLSCASPWNGWHSKCEAGVLLSKRHALFARHYLFQFGSGNRKLYFRTRDGSCYQATVVATNCSPATDLAVVLLNQDAPETVSVAKTLPADYRRYISTGIGLPMLTFDQEEKALIHDIGQVSSNGKSLGAAYPRMMNRYAQTEAIQTGDSGNPRFLIFGDEPILVSTITGPPKAPASGPFVPGWKDELQRLMDELSLGAGLSTNEYRLVECDFSGYQPLCYGESQ